MPKPPKQYYERKKTQRLAEKGIVVLDGNPYHLGVGAIELDTESAFVLVCTYCDNELISTGSATNGIRAAKKRGWVDILKDTIDSQLWTHLGICRGCKKEKVM